MRLLSCENDSKYITYREGTRKVNGVYQTCLHLTVHDKNISQNNKNNVVAKECITFQELLEQIMKGE
ncbi:MAG: hypothetical protein IJZ79_02130 [Bacilli bacterium]|nr:hypothetical protein [Bacilli bacterium]